MNLFDDQPDENRPHATSRQGKVLQPLSDDLKSSVPVIPASQSTPASSYKPAADMSGSTGNPAVSMLRQKINNLYANEPSAIEEMAEAKAQGRHSKHQKFMLELSDSGRSFAEIQTAWHNYYLALPDKEKHEVWQEFYSNHAKASGTAQKPAPVHSQAPVRPARKKSKRARTTDNRSVAEVKSQLLSNVSRRSSAPAGRGKSLLFGLGMGMVVLVILSFGFFNERFIAPFITPSRTVSSTPIIVDPDITTISPEPKIIIPKINVEVPVIYDEPSISEDAVQRALEQGTLHYPITSLPGESGNGAIFGHSSSNIFNSGQYKFAFVLLRKLEVGDTFMIQKDSKRYVYKVFDKKVVPPTDISVLNPIEGRASTMSLITCDPPGSSANRLVVIGEQISPNPSSNIASTADIQSASLPEELPSDAPTLWQRMFGWLSS